MEKRVSAFSNGRPAERLGQIVFLFWFRVGANARSLFAHENVVLLVCCISLGVHIDGYIGKESVALQKLDADNMVK